MRLLIFVFALCCSCNRAYRLPLVTTAEGLPTGSAYYKQVAAMKWKEREAIAVPALLAGDMPEFLTRFVRIDVNQTDSSGHQLHAIYFVAPDYLSIGTNHDFARVPLTPMAAQRIADSFHCFLPTRKMVDDIYKKASVKLEPVPLYAFRDSAISFWHHHLIIEGQRKGKKGLIAGIKKDLVISGKLLHDTRNDREAIYGWHQLNGKPIQPLYAGHINWWVDYSHGVRLVYEKIKVNGRWMNYVDVLKDPVYKRLLCDEENCDCYAYPNPSSTANP